MKRFLATCLFVAVAAFLATCLFVAVAATTLRITYDHFSDVRKMVDQELPIAERLTGPAIVTDGDTIRIGTRTIRLQAIDAPEMSQTCRNSVGTDYLCGRDAKDHLASIIGDFAVTCESAARDPQDRYGRMLGFCRRAPDGPSLNLAMVRAGHAVAYRHYIAGRPHEAVFIAAENEAREAMRGMWAGTFTMPWEWRAARRGG